MQRKIIVGLILLILSVNCLASFSVGFRVVLSGGVLPTLVLRYEHQSGHGVELSAGAMFNPRTKFIVRGELGYTYRYNNILVGVGRGITRHGAHGIPIFDDHIKISYNGPVKAVVVDVGGTLSLGTTGQGLALWGGINKQWNL